VNLELIGGSWPMSRELRENVAPKFENQWKNKNLYDDEVEI